MASVKVAVRVRPLNKREDALGSRVVVKVDGNIIQLTNNKASEPPYDIFTSRDKQKQFTFDHSYWSVDSSHDNYASQDKVFNDLGVGVVESAFSGYNACIFAYGQTGSGKTHTMMGTESNPGLTPRICEGMFASMDKPDLTYRTEVSYLEIYNERVRDLLRDGVQPTSLKVREHAKDGPYVQDLSRRVVTSYREIAEILRKGNVNRTTASTGMNEHSSRSHAIFTIYFSQARISGDLPSEINSKVHLVDLAGSERADTAGTSGERLREGGSINKSLVILGNVISALAEMNDPLANASSSTTLSSTTSASSRKFIPYRNSVLTWLLKDSLGGNSRTVMVATISPADCCYSETLSTLRYAKRAKKIVNMPSVNEDGNVRLIRELRAENAKLKRMLADAMMQEGLTAPSEVEETREKLSKNEEKIKTLELKVEEGGMLHGFESDGIGLKMAEFCQHGDSVKGLLRLFPDSKSDSRSSSSEKMQELMEAWTDKWKEVISVLKEHEMLALRKEGSGVLLDSGLPYLLCIDDSVLSTGMKLYHIKEGDTTVGRDNPIHRPDIALSGRFIENIHCIVRFEKGHCFLIPGENAMCCIDSMQVVEPTKLTQGSMIQLGRNHFFRFNDPVEAAKLREEMNEGYDRGNMSHIWKDIHRAWSTFSMTDSAIDSDVSMVKADARFKDWLECESEEVKKDEEDVHEVVGGAEVADDDEEEEDDRVKKSEFLADAQMKIKILNEKIENELKSVDKSELEDETLKGIGAEYEILRMEKERQEEEWCELEKQKQHQHTLRLDDQIIINKQQEHMDKVREAEKRIWSGEIEEMRALMDEEVQQLCDAPLNCLSRTPTISDDSSLDSRRQGPSSCRGTSFDGRLLRLPQSLRDAFECASLDGYDTRRDFPLVRHSTPLRSIVSDSTLEDVLPSDVETFNLLSPSVDERMDDLGSTTHLPMDLRGESLASLSLSTDDEGSTCSTDAYVANMYKVVRSMYFDEFGKSSRLARQHTKHLLLARQLNEKLLTMTKLISRSEKLSPDQFKSRSCDGKLDLLETLLNLYDSFSIMSQQQKNSMFSEAAQTLLRINQLAAASKQIIDEEVGDDEMKSLVQTEACLRREMFLYETSEQWDELVRWSNKKSRACREGGYRTSLELKLAVNNGKKIKSVCEALHLCGALDEKLKSFSKNFITQLMEPGVKGYFLPHCEDRPCLIQVTNSNNSSLIPLRNDDEEADESLLGSGTFSSSFSKNSASGISSPEKIVGRIEQSMRLLWCAFSFPLETSPSYSLVATVGENVHRETMQLLCQHCLVPYISSLDFRVGDAKPQKHRRQQRYHVPECRTWKMLNDVLLKVYNLQKQIVQFGFVPASSSSSCFLPILSRIRGCTINRRKDFIDCALKIGISTLGVSVNVSPDHPVGIAEDSPVEERAGESEGGSEEEVWHVEKFIVECIDSLGSLKMPLCSVSLPSCDVVKLLYSLLHEAQSCCPVVACYLQPCSEDISQHFLNLVCNQLPRNPAFDALLHNSCQFVAQHLMVVERHFSKSIPSLPEELAEEAYDNERNLRKIRGKLKATAEKHFSDSVLRQQQIIRELLPPPGTFACAADDGGNELRTCVRKVLDAAREVSNNWANVLSTNLYFRSIGILIDELVSCVVTSVLSILEFSEDDCAVLRLAMEDVMNSAPSYFITSSSSKVTNVEPLINDNVRDWMRMTELHRLLAMSLSDIRDRWSSGLGPLSLHFTGNQVASLVRAIFECTRKRELVIQEILARPSVHH